MRRRLKRKIGLCVLPGGEQGSMLMSILVSMAIMAMMATISIPYLRRFQPSLQLSGAAREIASDLRYAQQLTITEQVAHAVQFNLITDSYSVLKLTPGATSTVKTVFLPVEIEIDGVTGFTGDLVSFNSYGSVDESGQIVLMNSLNATMNVDVKPSGYIQTN